MKRVALWCALVLGAVCGCNKPQPSGTQPSRTGTPAAEPEANDPDEKPNEPLTPAARATMRERLVASLTQHPQPFLALRAPGVSSPLRPPARKAVALELTLAGARRWNDVLVSRLAVLSGDTQESLPLERIDANGALSYKFAHTGPAMLTACVGAKNDTRSDAFQHATHCTKIMLNVGDARPGPDTPQLGVMVETGMPLDVVPLVSPFELTVGSELPASFVFMNEEAENTIVAALRPDGSIDEKTTDAHGIARFTVTQPGRWVVRMVKTTEEGERIGELVFEVPEGRR